MERLDFTAYGMLILCVAAVASGQILFKYAAASGTGPALMDKLLHPAFLLGIIVYMLATLLWVWLLQTIPLHIAYPFMGLSFLFVPLFAAWLLGEAYSLRTLIGGVVILLGIFIVSK